MFARRRSSFLLPCFNIAFLTCLFVIGNVSTMSLERQRRQFQQQNDKQLEFSELILPEAESEMLQNDMELVPAIDGNSDMYLLIPASAATSPEQSLQPLSELSEDQKSDNIENSSDMLMQESEDTPAVQILELPEDAIETNIHDELVEKNVLDDETDLASESFEPVSESMLNTIAEAAQEIQNEIETELDRNEENREMEEFLKNEINKAKIEEQDNHEQGMIGVVMEEPNGKPEASLETESLQEEISAEDPQMDLKSEDSELQPVEDQMNLNLQDQSHEESASAIKKFVSGADSSVMETEKFEEVKIKEKEVNQRNDELEIKENDTQTSSLEQEDDIKENKDVKKSQASDEDNLESQEKVQSLEEYTQPEVIEEPQLLDEVKSSEEDNSDLSKETEIKLHEFKTEETQKESDDAPMVLEKLEQPNEVPAELIKTENIPSNDELGDKTEPIQDEVQVSSNEALASDQDQSPKPVADLLVEPQLFTETDTDEIQPNEEIDNRDQLAEVVAAGEKQTADEAAIDSENPHEELNVLSSNESDQFQETQMIIREHSTSDEQLPPAEEYSASILNDIKEQVDQQQLINEKQYAQEIQQNGPFEEVHQVIEAQSAAQENENEHINPAEETQSEVEFQPVKNLENLDINEEIRDFQSIQVPQNLEENQAVEDDHKMKDIQKAEKVQGNVHEQADEVLPVQNLEETNNGDETTAFESQAVDSVLSSELHQAVDDFKTADKTPVEISEESSTEDETQSVEESQTIGESVEDQTDEDVQNVEKVHLVNEIQSINTQFSDEEEKKPSEEQQFDTENNEADEIVKLEEPAVELESLIEETQDEENYTHTSLLSEEVQLTETPEFADIQKDSDLDAKPVEISADEIIPEESYKPEEEKEDAGHLNVLKDENILENIKDNQDETEQHATVEIQKPLDHKNSDNILNGDKNESETEKENTTLLTTIAQVATNEELIHQQQHEKEPQIVVEEIVSSTTLKPLNVFDSVLNYVNASFMNQMSNNNNDNNNRQKTKEEEQVFSSKLRRYDGAQVWRIVVQNDRERKLADELQTKYDGQLWKEVKQEVDYLLKPQVLADAEQHVRAANLSRIVLIDNLQKVIEVENPPAEEIEELQNRKGSRLTWQAYHRLDDIHSYFDFMAKTYPDICSVEVIGYSIEKRPLKILKISNGNANNPGIWIDGGMHAREWISPAVVTFIANQIIEGWDDLPAYMRNINWYVHAVANPDGYEYSHTTDRLWRKNMRSHGRACPGVDLNRNFGYKWGGKGTSANPCSQTYRGSKAFSEPETFYISKFISNFPRETFKAYLSFHSYGQYILYPWGYDYHITTDMADLDLVARQAGTIITKSSGAKFTVGSSATTLYPAAGGSDDWAKGIAGIKYSYTIEMGDTGRYGFVLPADQIEPNGKNGFTFVKTVAKAITMGKNARRRKLKAHKTH